MSDRGISFFKGSGPATVAAICRCGGAGISARAAPCMAARPEAQSIQGCRNSTTYK